MRIVLGAERKLMLTGADRREMLAAACLFAEMVRRRCAMMMPVRLANATP